jgi:uncharacterized membrane protein YbhN (UPF0104 family)
MARPAAESTRSGTRVRRAAAILGTVLVLVVGGVLAVRTIEIGRVVETVRTANPAVLVLAAGVYLGSWPLRGRRYGDVLAAMDRRCGVGFLTAAVFVSQTANLVVPARAGDGVRAYLLNARRAVPYTTGVASLAVERLFDLLALAGLGAVALAWVVLAGEGAALAESGRFLAGAGGVALAGLLVTAATVGVARSDWHPGPRLREFTDRPRLRAAADAAVGFGADLRVVATDGRALAHVAAGSLAIWAIDVLTAVLVLAALDGTLSTPALVAVGTLAVTVGNLAKVLPLSQGGIGLYEAAFTALVVAVSPVGAATALAAAVVDHALKNAVTLAGGAVAALALNLSPGSVRRKTSETDAES